MVALAGARFVAFAVACAMATAAIANGVDTWPNLRRDTDFTRPWSMRFDEVDTAKALQDSYPVDVAKGNTIDKLLEGKGFVVLVAAPSDFRKRGVRYDGTEDLYLAWRALIDLPATVPDVGSAVADLDASVEANAQHLEAFIGRSLIAVPRLFVFVKATLINTGAWRNVTVDSDHLSFLRPTRDPDWFEAGLERGGDRVYNEVAFLAEAFPSPPVHTFCTEAEHRDLIRLSLGANYALLSVWDEQDEYLRGGMALRVALTFPRNDFLVAVFGTPEECAARPAMGNPDALEHQRDDGARRELRSNYNPWGYQVTMHLVRPEAEPGRGFVTVGTNLVYLFDELGRRMGQTVEERLDTWIRIVRRSGYPLSAIRAIAERKHKVTLQPPGSSCPVDRRPRVHDTVLVEGILLSGKGLVESSRWSQRNVTIGVCETDFPCHFDALLLEACEGLGTNVATADEVEGEDDVPTAFHLFTILAIKRPRAGVTTKVSHAEMERDRVLLVKKAIDQYATDASILTEIERIHANAVLSDMQHG
jgi:hypothetical protein